MIKKISNIDNKYKLLNKSIKYKLIKLRNRIQEIINLFRRKIIKIINIKNNHPKETTVLQPILLLRAIIIEMCSLNQLAIGPSTTITSTIQQDNTPRTTPFRHPPSDINHLNRKRMNSNLKLGMWQNQEKTPIQMSLQTDKTLRMYNQLLIKQPITHLTVDRPNYQLNIHLTPPKTLLVKATSSG